VWVADATDLTIRVFAPDGNYKSSVGRRGRGPGEFQLLRGLGWIGDTVYVLDQVNVRATLFREDGSVLRDFRLPQSAVGYGAVSPFRLLSTTEVLASPQLGREVFQGEAVIPLVRVPIGAGQPTSITQVSVAGMTAVLSVQDRNFMVSGTELVRIARPSTPWTVSRDNRSVLKVDRVPGEPGRDQVLVALTLAGDTLYTRVLPYEPLAVPEAVADSLYRSMLVHLSGVPEGAAMDAVRSTIPRPRWYPPFLRIVAGRDGSVFVERSHLPGDPARWEMLDAEGRPVGVVDLPSAVQVETVSLSVVWAVRTNPDDTQDLVRFRLQQAVQR
jgi:hypothetical protein